MVDETYSSEEVDYFMGNILFLMIKSCKGNIWSINQLNENKLYDSKKGNRQE